MNKFYYNINLNNQVISINQILYHYYQILAKTMDWEYFQNMN